MGLPNLEEGLVNAQHDMPFRFEGAGCDAATLEAVAALLEDYSIEVTPREAAAIGSFGNHLAPGTRVYVPFLRHARFGDTLATARKLAHDRMRPVVHIAARAVRDEQHLRDMLAALTGEAGVREVLAIGGDLSRPVGEFTCALELLRTGLFERHGITEIAFAAHPEGSPAITDSALDDAVLGKMSHASNSSARCRWVTQLCFTAAPVREWISRVQSFGNTFPVHVGVHGVTHVRTLLKYARVCGVGASARALLRLRERILSMQRRTPLAMLAELAAAQAQAAHPAPMRIHLFSFGAFAATAHWANEMAALKEATDGCTSPLLCAR